MSPVLAENRRLNTAAGRTAFAVLLFQDLMVAPLLFAVSMAGDRGGGSGADMLYAILPAMAALAAAEAKEAEVTAIVAGLKAKFDTQMAEKTRLDGRVAEARGAVEGLHAEAALALRRKAALATYDAEMIAAAPRAGIRLFPKSLAVQA